MESRVLIYAPIGKDARLISEALARAGVSSYVCARATDVDVELKKGAGMLLLVEEVLDTPIVKQLVLFLQQQPTWSDLPILVLSHRVLDSPEIRHTYFHLGNVTLLERPVQMVTLTSAVTAALRTRKRQYAMREIDTQKDEFLAMLAHELRNPLAPVSTAAVLLKIPHLDREKIRKTSEIISRQVKHMTGLIDDLLDMSRVSRGLISLDTDVQDAAEIVRCAVEQVRPLIDERKHVLSLKTSSEPAFIKGDQKRLVQVLSNVLNNASKYTPDRGNIELTTQVSDTEVKFIVSDNGIGMYPELIEHIFEMFAQAKRTSDRTQGGLGIGLALVKNLVQLHGGTVAAQSAGLGLGSEFQITLPRTFRPLPEITNPIVPVNSHTSDLLILVVDDNVDAAKTLALLLELVGYRVEVAHRAGVALDIARSSARIHACLLDIGLPDMDGSELARKLRDIPSTASSKFIAITGYGQEADRRNTREAGFDQHHVKPVDIDKLCEALSAQ